MISTIYRRSLGQCFRYFFGLKKRQGLSFRITPQQARNIMQKDSRFYYDPIPDIPDQSQTHVLQKVYLPFYSADVKNVMTVYYGQLKGQSISWSKEQSEKVSYDLNQHLKNRLTPSGVLMPIDYSFKQKNLQVYADFELPRKIIEQCVTQDITSLSVITQKQTQNAQKIIQHKMSQKLAVEKIIEKIKEMEKKRAYEQLNKKINRIDFKASIRQVLINQNQVQIEIKRFYLPAYIFKSTKVEDGLKIVNGYSGKCQGFQRYNNTKIGLTTMGITFIISVLTEAEVQSYFYIFPISYAFGHILGIIWNNLDRKQYIKDKIQRETDFLSHFKEQQHETFSISKQRRIMLTVQEQNILQISGQKFYTEEEFLELIKNAKTVAIQSSKDVSTKKVIQLLKQIDHVETQVIRKFRI